MSENHEPAAATADRYHFLIHRLHSLTGLVPVGVFLVLHLSTNASVLAPGAGGMEFQKSVERIHALGPLLVPVEIVGIFLPLLFHSIIGFQIIFTGRSNAQHYRYGGNIRYSLQRATGVIAFVFILYHVWQLHWLGRGLGGGGFAVHNESGGPAAALTTAQAIQAAWWIAPLYAIGIVACVYHLANGIWTSLITWGITIRPYSQRVAGYFCTGFGVILTLVGLGALSGFRTFDVVEGKAAQTAQTVRPTPQH
jgi:succinate dehydrogenase / fumarate reductase cytochrome b subunit